MQIVYSYTYPHALSCDTIRSHMEHEYIVLTTGIPINITAAIWFTVLTAAMYQIFHAKVVSLIKWTCFLLP